MQMDMILLFCRNISHLEIWVFIFKIKKRLVHVSNGTTELPQLSGCWILLTAAQVFRNCMSEPERIAPSCTVEDYLSSELLVFFELRVRYLQACDRIQEAKALSKSCLENCEAGKHLYFRQAYLTCLYKASLHEHLRKEVKWPRLIWKSLKWKNEKQSKPCILLKWCSLIRIWINCTFSRRSLSLLDSGDRWPRCSGDNLQHRECRKRRVASFNVQNVPQAAAAQWRYVLYLVRYTKDSMWYYFHYYYEFRWVCISACMRFTCTVSWDEGINATM